ncbi:hypothetical protein BS78_08G157800 [Paspalum vaginatum]|nr:hypothetical protein BS78_08G157800 [Paspalum vaginatum]
MGHLMHTHTLSVISSCNPCTGRGSDLICASRPAVVSFLHHLSHGLLHRQTHTLTARTPSVVFVRVLPELLLIHAWWPPRSGGWHHTYGGQWIKTTSLIALALQSLPLPLPPTDDGTCCLLHCIQVVGGRQMLR